MLEVVGFGISNAKVVDDKSEGDIFGVVAEEAVGMLALGVAVFFEEGAELCVCEDACLGETIHPLPYLHHDVSIFY